MNSSKNIIFGWESYSIENYYTICLQDKHYDNHGSGYERYFPIGSISASITGVEVQTLLIHYDVVVFYSIICLILCNAT